MKILFLVPYPLNEAPSQRFRFEQYFSALEKSGFRAEVQPFLNSHIWQEFSKKGNAGMKAIALVKGFVKRFVTMFRVPFFDFVFIHREASPIGPPIFEWIITRICRKRLIYDFDDAIWLTDRINEPVILRASKWRHKVWQICRWAYKVSCGNHYLASYALQFNDSVFYNPTTIDTAYHLPENTNPKRKSTVTIGWTGSYSTLKYMKSIEPVLQRIEREFEQTRFVIIADERPSLDLKRLSFIPWNLNNEIRDLQEFDIGLMPLPDDAWAPGKCGFKILQYLSLEIPAVASPVGVNADMVQEGVTGFLCTSSEAWYAALKNLIEDENLRRSFGSKGREFVLANYSVSSNTSTFLCLFR